LVMLCSDCFKNEGLRLEALKLGDKRSEKCPRCGSEKGALLNEDQCGELLERFFIYGTTSIGTFGISPYKLGAGNPHDVKFDATLKDDFETLIGVDALGLRLRAPKTWLVGDTKHWGAFEEMIEYRRTTGKLPENAAEIIDEILQRCRKFTLPKGTRFYRIRKNPAASIVSESYDSPPSIDKPSRLSLGAIPILYGAFDVETCIHESRCRIDDEICIATIETLSDVSTVDLGDAPYYPEKEDPWTSPSIFLSQVMRSPQHDECQIIGERAFEQGVSAVQFPSFFSQVLDQEHANIAIFGHPLKDRKAHIQSLNRIKLERVRYDYILGPIYDNTAR
jgi:RES domain-containing protein